MDTNPVRSLVLVNAFRVPNTLIWRPVVNIPLAVWQNAYGSSNGDPNWNPNLDFNQSGTINGADYSYWVAVYGFMFVVDLTGAKTAIVELVNTMDQAVTVQFYSALGATATDIQSAAFITAPQVTLGPAIVVPAIAAGVPGAASRFLPPAGGAMPTLLWCTATVAISPTVGSLSVTGTTIGTMNGME